MSTSRSNQRWVVIAHREDGTASVALGPFTKQAEAQMRADRLEYRSTLPPRYTAVTAFVVPLVAAAPQRVAYDALGMPAKAADV